MMFIYLQLLNRRNPLVHLLVLPLEQVQLQYALTASCVQSCAENKHT